MARMQNAQPARKVIGGTLAAALTTIVVWGVNASGVMTDPIPAHISGALTTVLTFLVGYYLPPSENDQIVSG